jgi:sarcosine oxidase subunit alpha
MRITDHPVLDFESKHKKKITFYFEGKEMPGFEDEPIIAALHDNGIRHLSDSLRHRHARGFYCAIGKCASCLMEVDGKANVRVCITPLKQGMHIRRQAPLPQGDVHNQSFENIISLQGEE